MSVHHRDVTVQQLVFLQVEVARVDHRGIELDRREGPSLLAELHGDGEAEVDRPAALEGDRNAQDFCRYRQQEVVVIDPNAVGDEVGFAPGAGAM